MANPYQTTNIPNQRAQQLEEDRDQTSVLVALIIIAAFVVAGIAYAYYYKIYNYDNQGLSDTASSSAVVPNAVSRDNSNTATQ